MFKTAKDGLTILGLAGGIGGCAWMGYRAAKDGSRELAALIDEQYEKEKMEVAHETRDQIRTSVQYLYGTKNFVANHKVGITFVSTVVLCSWFNRRAWRQFDMFLDEKGLTDEFYLADEVEQWLAETGNEYLA